jgi:monoamine oxidase
MTDGPDPADDEKSVRVPGGYFDGAVRAGQDAADRTARKL